MISLTSFSLSLAASLLGASLGSPAETAPSRLKVGVVQMAVAQTVEANRDRIVSGIPQAAAHGIRVAVFPEGVLRGQGGHWFNPRIGEQTKTNSAFASQTSETFTRPGPGDRVLLLRQRR